MTLKTLIKIAFCLILLFVNNAAAQQTPTTLVGRIFSPYADGVRNATITIKLISKKFRYQMTTTSDEAGKYLFPSIPPGSYRVSATDRNGLTYENPPFDVPADRMARLDLMIEYGGNCLNSAGTPPTLNDADKAVILNQMLRDVLLKKQIPMYEQLKRQKTGIVLSGENIKAEWLRPIKNLNLSVLSDADIRRKAEGGSEFMYLGFGKLKVKGDCVVSSVSNLWAVNTKSSKTPTSGGGRVFVYNKKGGKFKLKTSGSWNF